MKTSEIKLQLIHQIDSLKKDQLMELFGVVKNFINNMDNSEEWNNLSESQKMGLEYGLNELNEGKSIEHHIVMEDLIKKYGIQ